AAAAVAGGEHAGDPGGELAVLCLHGAARVDFHLEILEQHLFGSEKAHGEQDELRRAALVRAGNLDRNELALLVPAPFDLHGDQRRHGALLIAVEALDGPQIAARIGAEPGRSLFLAVVHLVDLRPLGPRVVRRTLGRRLRHDLDLREAPASLTYGGCDAVRARVVAADHDHVLAARVYGRAVRLAVQQRLGACGQVVHGELHSSKPPSFDGKVAWSRGARADDDRIEVLAQQLRLDVLTNVGVAHELDAFLLHEFQAPLDHVALVELHVRDAVHQQAARAVGALQHGDAVAGPIELCGRREAGRSGADHHNLLAGAVARRLWNHPALLPAAIDDGRFDGLDGHRLIADAEYAGSFAGRRADAAGEIGKVVGHVQALERLPPQPAVDQVVPLRDHVVDRAARGHAADQLARVTEGDAAIHAARRL